MTQDNDNSHEKSEGFVLAPLWKRIISTIIDSLIFVIPASILMMFSFTPTEELLAQGPPPVYTAISLVFQFVLFPLYTIYFIGNYGMTLGQKALKIKVVHVDGASVDYKIAALRWVATLIYNLPFVGLLIAIASFFMIAFDKKKQSIHDKFAKTLVVE